MKNKLKEKKIKSDTMSSIDVGHVFLPIRTYHQASVWIVVRPLLWNTGQVKPVEFVGND